MNHDLGPKAREFLHRLDDAAPQPPPFPSTIAINDHRRRTAGNAADEPSDPQLVGSPVGARGPRRVLIAAAATIAVVGLAGVVVVRDRDGDVGPTAQWAPPTTSAATLPEVSPTETPVSVCARELGSFVAEHGVFAGLDARGLVGDHRSVELDVAGEPGARHVLLLDDELVFSCVVVPADTAMAPAVRDRVPYGGELRAIGTNDTGDDDLDVIVLSTMPIGDDVTTGPGTFTIAGAAGDNVDEVEARLADGSRIDGHIAAGWFSITGHVPAGVPLADLRVSWTLVDGTDHSSRADLLDQTTDDEECAATAGCVPARIAALHQQAVDNGLLEQAAALADGVVTTEERESAAQHHVDCLTANGIDASRTGTEISIFADPTEIDATVTDQCHNAHSLLVGHAHLLQDAERRLTEG